MEVERFELMADGHRLEAERYGLAGAPSLVLLHEGLGSVSAWREWPAELHARTQLGVVTYSRWGYGRSDPVEPPRPLDYMQREAQASLPQVLDALGAEQVVLLGHSDGASIALVYAGAFPDDPRIQGVVAMAPHVFCEVRSVEAIARARDAYLNTGFRERLSQHHQDVDGAFWGWNRAWLDPQFMDWNIESFLPAIRVPVLLIQSADDPYGTLAQVDAITRAVAGSAERLIFDAPSHSPHRDAHALTTEAVASFAARTLQEPAGT